MVNVTQDDIERVVSSGLDDGGHLWFGCWLKDGRLVQICWELDEMAETDIFSGIVDTEQ